MDALLLLIPFLNLIVMSLIKWLFSDEFKSAVTRNWRLRAILLTLSFVGTVANSVINGSPVDASVVGEFLTILVITVGEALASHVSYKMVKLA